MIIASVSGGLSSGEMLRRLVDQHGKENVTAVFADVKGNPESHYFSPFKSIDMLLHERFGGESQGLYRFLWQLSYAMDEAGTLPSRWGASQSQTGCACFTLPGFEDVPVKKPTPRRKREMPDMQ